MDQLHGEMDVSADGIFENYVDTYRTFRKMKVLFYSTKDYNHGDHSLSVAITNGQPPNKAIGIHGIYYLNNGCREMFKISSKSITIEKSQESTLIIDRIRGSNESASVRIKTESGTAMDGKQFSAIDQINEFGDGEAQKTIVVKAFNFFHSKLIDTQFSYNLIVIILLFTFQ